MQKHPRASLLTENDYLGAAFDVNHSDLIKITEPMNERNMT